jgi:nitronate monooxygenase
MYYASTPSLAAAVSSGGGLGMIAAGADLSFVVSSSKNCSSGFSSSAQLKDELGSIRSSLNISAGSPLPAGVGLIGWILDRTETSDDPRLPTVLAEMPTAVWFASGNDLGKYVAQVRTYDATRSHKTVIFVVVNNLDDALRAEKDWMVDVIVVQGILVFHL